MSFDKPYHLATKHNPRVVVVVLLVLEKEPIGVANMMMWA